MDERRALTLYAGPQALWERLVEGAAIY